MARIQKRVAFRLLAAMATAIVIFPIGCDTTYHEYFTERLDNLQRTATVIETLESEQPKLDRLLTIIENQHKRDVAQMEKLPAELERLLEQDVSWWERNLPIHERRLHEMMRGDVGNIERTLPKMLY